VNFFGLKAFQKGFKVTEEVSWQ